ncbi:MAG: LacI family transcriptional regulator [Planctomycetota bacterium]|nr:LacI family transcriptional regulator [Planctomycetota bacterium]
MVSDVEIHSTPKYAVLKDLLVSQIEGGKLRPGQKIPTQRELMAEHKLSYSTVSRALQELVREGYITRLVGSGSRVCERARGSAVFHLVGVPASAHRGLKVFQDLLEAARRLGARVEPHEDLDQDGRAALVERVLAARGDKTGPGEGLVFPYFAGNRKHIERLREAGGAYVVLDVPHAMPGYTVVLRDHKAAARALVQRLLAAGHRPERIGCILGARDEAQPDPVQWDRAKAEGAAEALGGLHPDRTEWQVGPHVEAGELAALRLLDRAPQLTAIYCDNDRKAAGVWRHLSARGLKVPQDVSLACMNLPARDLKLPLDLACAWASAEGVGAAAAQVLSDLLAGRASAPVTRELSMQVQDGATIAPPRA